MKAIIPAAGLGTRFLPATKSVPKEMLPVLDKPTIQYIIEEAQAAGADEIIIVNSLTKPAIEAHFDQDEALVELLESTDRYEYAAKVKAASDLPVSYVIQEQQLGLGHAVYCAAEKIIQSNEPFFVLLGDVIVPDNAMLTQMLQVSEAHNGASVIAVIQVPDEETGRFGIIAGEDLSGFGEPNVWHITGMVEKPKSNPPSNLAIFGRYLLSPNIMQILANTKPGAGGEIQLTDAMIELLQNEEVYALVINAEDGFDVGTISNWILANVMMAARDAEYLGLIRQLSSVLRSDS
ncbi:MAG: UTP--glucose-1-phosphate uridylyltransferase [Coriobacteriia bacterium]|nr:UTP--glucose-1-phosphate uridylyltransferase [Coriobacteriia bacterium]